MDLFDDVDVFALTKAYNGSRNIIIGVYALYGVIIGIWMGIDDPDTSIGTAILSGLLVAAIGAYLFKHWGIEKNEYESWKLFLVGLFIVVTFPALFVAYIVISFKLDKDVEDKIDELQAEQKYLEGELVTGSNQLHELRVERFGTILRKSKKIRLSDFSELLQVEKADLMAWIYDLPDQYEITINGDYVEFGEQIKDKAEEIINLLEKPEINFTD